MSALQRSKGNCPYPCDNLMIVKIEISVRKQSFFATILFEIWDKILLFGKILKISIHSLYTFLGTINCLSVFYSIMLLNLSISF